MYEYRPISAKAAIDIPRRAPELAAKLEAAWFNADPDEYEAPRDFVRRAFHPAYRPREHDEEYPSMLSVGDVARLLEAFEASGPNAFEVAISIGEALHDFLDGSEWGCKLWADWLERGDDPKTVELWENPDDWWGAFEALWERDGRDRAVRPRVDLIERLASATKAATQAAFDVAAGKTKAPSTKHEKKMKSTATATGLSIVRLSDVQEKPIEWVWKGRFPVGMVSLVAGKPKLGKSTLLFDIAARITRAKDWPDGAPGIGKPGRVIYFAAEDDLATTLKPRFIAAGGDPSRFIVVRAAILGDGKRRSFKIGEDLALIERAVPDLGPGDTLFFDPASSYVGKVDGDSNTDLRGVLDPLAEFASRHGIAVVCNHHFRKGRGGDARERINGSMAWSAVARSNYVVVEDAADPDRRLFLDAGGNVSKRMPGLAFRIVEATTPSGVEATRIQWDDEPVTVTADEAVEALDRKAEGPSREDQAVEWLRGYMADSPIVPSKTVKSDSEAAGHSWRTIERAKQQLGIDKYQSEGRWWWVAAGFTSTEDGNEEL